MAIEAVKDFEYDSILIEDTEGNEQEAFILATFKETETDRVFVLYTLIEDEAIDEDSEIEVYASILDAENENFIEIESDEDWELVEQVLQTLTVEEE